jgi:hypothetical protein
MLFCRLHYWTTQTHSTYSVELLWTSDQPVAETCTWQQTQHSQQTDIHAPVGIGTHNPSKRAAADPRIRPRGHWDWHFKFLYRKNSESLSYNWSGSSERRVGWWKVEWSKVRSIYTGFIKCWFDYTTELSDASFCYANISRHVLM